MKLDQFRQALLDDGNQKLRVASDEDIQSLKALGFPEVAIQFYRETEPYGCDDDPGAVELSDRMWGIRYILRENLDGVPGTEVVPHGYLVFASTLCGDAYCFNMNKSRDGDAEVVILSHELDFPSDSDLIHKVAKPVASSFQEFIDLFTARQLDDECLYE